MNLILALATEARKFARRTTSFELSVGTSAARKRAVTLQLIIGSTDLPDEQPMR
jgi:hypothetical protein